MRLRTGTSGFSYKEWKGPFYPKTLPASKMLEFYAQQLEAVEINSSFYRMPKASVLKGWAEKVPEGFVFVLKASRRITHHGRLEGVQDSVDYLWELSAALGPHLGPFLFQLPPNLKKDIGRLRGFLAGLPNGMRAAFEFRDGSWFDEETYACLREAAQTLCFSDMSRSDSRSLVSTSDWGYLRLRREAYSDADLAEWLQQMRRQRWKEAFVFFKHEDEGAAPRLARRLAKLAQAD